MKQLFLPVVLAVAMGWLGAGCDTFKCGADGKCATDGKAGLAAYVNPRIGCADNGHTFPAASYPFGMIQAGPDTGNCSWRYCSGYMDLDRVIHAFSQTHLNGTGCSDLGDVRLMPFTGPASIGVKSSFRKETERATPGFYAVELDDYGVKAEVTCASHTALYNYTYKDASAARLLVDLQYGIVFDEKHLTNRVLACEEKVEDEYTISGHIRAKCWVTRDYYYVIKFSSPFTARERVAAPAEFKAPIYAFDFKKLPADGKLSVKVALSTVSVEGARANMNAEVPAWDFAGTLAKNVAAWNKMLERVTICGSDEQKISFYTSLYHLFIQPNNVADVNGQYRGIDGKVAQLTGGHKGYYSTLSLWDTFRAAHPLYTIITPDYVGDFVDTMLRHQKAHGILPVWALWGQENYCMIGNHGVPVVVDAYFKGFPMDAEAAYAAVKASLTTKKEGHPKSDFDLYEKFGYLPIDIIKGESVSRTLEDCYDFYCAARFAEALGKKKDADFFAKRAQLYKNLFDAKIKFMRPRNSDGSWYEPFDPVQLGHGAGTFSGFTEGNAWQYSWHVMQDPDALITLMGGKPAFLEKLDSLFKQNSKTEGEGFVLDVSGLIGQYAHGNEPSHHVAYLFAVAGQPWRTQELVRQICDEMYKAAPDGLCGNDDCGQMSAWYIFSCLGFYPMNPCDDGYVLGAPQVPYAKVQLPAGKQLTMEAKNFSVKNLYVKSVTLNGQPVTGIKLTHAQVMGGGKLVFEMTDTPVK